VDASTPPPASASPTPQDADDTRGAHLRSLARHPVTLSLTSTLAIVALIVGTLAVSILVGAGAAVAVVLLAVVIVFVLASGRAEADFFRAYAAERGLTDSGRRDLPPFSPLLRKGDKRSAEHVLKGTLPGGWGGTLAHYTYTEVTRDSKGNRHETDYDFTVAILDVPGSAPFAGELYCQRRFGFRFLDSAEDVFRKNERVELESEQLDKTYEIFADKGTDWNWLRQLFSPTFIVWLAESAPEEFAFELVAGILVVNVKGHLESAARLDGFCASAGTVAHRITEEAHE
jgi:hypothetical protein